MGFGLEVDMIREAHAKDLLTTPYVFGEDDAAAMAAAGADIVVCHLGLTTGGSIGAGDRAQARGLPGQGRRLGRGGDQGQPGRDRAGPRRAGRDSPRTPPSSSPNTELCHGFYGASSMERLPAEAALTEQTRKFKQIGRGRG